MKKKSKGKKKGASQKETKFNGPEHNEDLGTVRKDSYKAVPEQNRLKGCLNEIKRLLRFVFSFSLVFKVQDIFKSSFTKITGFHRPLKARKGSHHQTKRGERIKGITGRKRHDANIKSSGVDQKKEAYSRNTANGINQKASTSRQPRAMAGSPYVSNALEVVDHHYSGDDMEVDEEYAASETAPFASFKAIQRDNKQLEDHLERIRTGLEKENESAKQEIRRLEDELRDCKSKLTKDKKAHRQTSLLHDQLVKNQQKQLSAQEDRLYREQQQERESLNMEIRKHKAECEQVLERNDQLEKLVTALKGEKKLLESDKKDLDHRLQLARDKTADALKQSADDRKQHDELLECRIAQSPQNLNIAENIRPDTVTKAYKEVESNQRIDALDCLEHAGTHLDDFEGMKLLCNIVMMCRQKTTTKFAIIAGDLTQALHRNLEEQQPLRDITLIELRSELRLRYSKTFADEIVQSVRDDLGQDLPDFISSKDQETFDAFLSACADLAWRMEILAEPFQLVDLMGQTYDPAIASLYSGVACKTEGTIRACFWPALVSKTSGKTSVQSKGLVFTAEAAVKRKPSIKEQRSPRDTRGNATDRPRTSRDLDWQEGGAALVTSHQGSGTDERWKELFQENRQENSDK